MLPLDKNDAYTFREMKEMYAIITYFKPINYGLSITCQVFSTGVPSKMDN